MNARQKVAARIAHTNAAHDQDRRTKGQRMVADPDDLYWEVVQEEYEVQNMRAFRRFSPHLMEELTTL